MCTATIVPLGDGFRLACNRDERRDRPAASPPAICTLRHRRAVFPVDPLGPGTWVGVNEKGLSMTLLNRTDSPRPPFGAIPARSRGIIIPALLDAASLDDALAGMAGFRVEDFLPFRLLIAYQKRAAILTSNGANATLVLMDLGRPVMLTSSSLGDALVEGPRRRLFEELFCAGRRSWLPAQRRFHRHHWRSRGEISVLMERDDARTVSHTVITVGGGKTELRYRAIDSRDDVSLVVG